MSLVSRLRDRLSGFWSTDDDQPPEVHVDPDDVYDVLSAERRRLTIEFLAYDIAPHEATDLDALATYVAAREHDVLHDEVTADQRKRAYVNLYQSHLVKLHELDIIEWDRRDGTIRRGRSVEELAAYINHIRRATTPGISTPDLQVETSSTPAMNIEVKPHA